MELPVKVISPGDEYYDLSSDESLSSSNFDELYGTESTPECIQRYNSGDHSEDPNQQRKLVLYFNPPKSISKKLREALIPLGLLSSESRSGDLSYLSCSTSSQNNANTTNKKNLTTTNKQNKTYSGATLQQSELHSNRTNRSPMENYRFGFKPWFELFHQQSSLIYNYVKYSQEFQYNYGFK